VTVTAAAAATVTAAVESPADGVVVTDLPVGTYMGVLSAQPVVEAVPIVRDSHGLWRALPPPQF
jgi:hypothetical protein